MKAIRIAIAMSQVKKEVRMASRLSISPDWASFFSRGDHHANHRERSAQKTNGLSTWALSML
ncbi:MAG: hypothetical protein R2825_17780 [Saprospiraceae bacterium]